MSYLAVIVAAAAAFAWGAVWYTINGKRWMDAIGLTEEQMKADKSPKPFIIAGIVVLVSAGMMRHIMSMAGITDVQGGIIAGLGIGAFIATPWMLIHYGFAKQPKPLWWLDSIHTIVGIAIIGGVLGAF